MYPRGSAESKMAYGEDYKHATPMQRDLRKAVRYKGPGDYKKVWRSIRKYVPRGLGAAGAYALGYKAKSGWDLGAKASKAVGWGDYSVNQITSAPGSMNPHQNIHHVSTVASDLSGDIIYSNTEFVKNIYASGTGGSVSSFELSSFVLNPAVSETFPFLSQIAQNFELYEFMGLMFQYKPTSGNYGNSESNSLGKVVLCTNYDPDAPEFKNTIVMENYDYACSTLPAQGCIHGVECAPSQRSVKQLYTRTGQSSKDKVFTDLGLFQISTEGIPFGGSGSKSALIGELWVTYTVKLSRAKLTQALGQSISHATYQLSLGTDFGAKTFAADLDNTIEFVSTTPVGLQIAKTDVNNVTLDLSFGSSFGNSRYLFIWTHTATPASVFEVAANTPTNCSIIEQLALYQGTTKGVSYILIEFDSSFQGVASVRFSATNTPSATQIDSLAISKVDPDFTLTVNS